MHDVAVSRPAPRKGLIIRQHFADERLWPASMPCTPPPSAGLPPSPRLRRTSRPACRSASAPLG